MPRLREVRYARWAETRFQQWQEDRPTILAFDTETTGLGFYDEPFASTLTWQRPDGSMLSAYLDLECEGRERRIEILHDMLVGTGVVVCHNLKFDAQKAVLIGALSMEEIDALELHDTQTAYMLLDENQTKGLKDLAVRVLGYNDTAEVEVKSGKNKGKTKLVPKEAHRLNEIRRKLGLKKEDGYHLLPRTFLIPYALRDTEFTLRLHEELQPRLLAKDDPALLELYRTEMQLQLVLLRMEADGFELDIPYLEQTTSEYGVRVMEKWDRVVQLVGDSDFNPRSPDQVKRAFEARGIELVDTQAKTLLSLDDELAEALLAYRDDFKLHQTYLLGLGREHRNGRIHPNFNPSGARTGRMSSSSAKE